jgi:hypothetical protein
MKKKRKRDDTPKSSAKITSNPFWCDVSKILSKKMWFQPTEHTTSIGTFGNNSWFNFKIQKGRSESQTIWDWRTIQQTHEDSKSVEEPPKKKAKAKKSNKEAAEKVIKIRLYPDKQQDQILKRWFGTARWTYSQCLSAVEKEKVKKTKKALRAKCLNADNFEKKKQMGSRCILRCERRGDE